MTDPSIILFGKKIGLPETTNATNLSPFPAANGRENTEDAVAVAVAENTMFTPHDQRKDESDDDLETPIIDTDGDTMNTQAKTLKKPEKILPCPRCDSMNTKFCYFNNSNVNQPRHFCKSCQRYWTAGGTMRNMPVGAGRRKKKTPPSNYRYIVSQEAFESEAAANHIEFSRDSGRNSANFGVSGQETVDCSSSSVVEKIQDNNGFQSHFHWIQGASWPYNPWNTPVPIPMPMPPVYPPGYPQIPMYPPPYWSSVSWLPPTSSILGKHPTDEKAVKPSDSNEECKKQKNLILIPKTLRIHDPDEAAKSSIWATLGIKNEHSGRGDLFKAFQSKGNDKKKNKATEPSPVLQANPAAFSRSLSFQERA